MTDPSQPKPSQPKPSQPKPSQPSDHTLFVYGTLMSGEVSAHLMAGAALLGPAQTAPCYTLHRIEWYPGMADGGATAIHGEVYRVPADVMARLDAYEGPEYRRVHIPLSHGPVARAEAYVMPSAIASGLPIMPSGDWRRR